MSTPARILTALFLLALGIAGAWLFRKPHGAFPDHPGERELVLREARKEGAAPLPGEDAWRGTVATSRAGSKGPLASIRASEAPSAPPLPIPRAAVTGPVALADETDGGAPHEYRADLSAADEEPALHVVADGDSLESLARHYLGDARRAGEVLAANRAAIPRPDVLPIGLTLVIPAKSSASLSPGATPADAWRKPDNERP